LTVPIPTRLLSPVSAIHRIPLAWNAASQSCGMAERCPTPAQITVPPSTTTPASVTATATWTHGLHSGARGGRGVRDQCRIVTRPTSVIAQRTTNSRPALVGDHAIPISAKIGPNRPATA
jgi:hypothetical protein